MAENHRNQRSTGYAQSASGRSRNRPRRGAPSNRHNRRNPQGSNIIPIIPEDDIKESVGYEGDHCPGTGQKHDPFDRNVGLTDPQCDAGMSDTMVLNISHLTGTNYGSTALSHTTPCYPASSVSSPAISPNGNDAELGEWGSADTYHGQHMPDGSAGYILSSAASFPNLIATTSIEPRSETNISAGAYLSYQPWSGTDDVSFNSYGPPTTYSPTRLETYESVNDIGEDGPADYNSFEHARRWSMQNNRGSVV